MGVVSKVAFRDIQYRFNEVRPKTLHERSSQTYIFGDVGIPFRSGKATEYQFYQFSEQRAYITTF